MCILNTPIWHHVNNAWCKVPYHPLILIIMSPLSEVMVACGRLSGFSQTPGSLSLHKEPFRGTLGPASLAVWLSGSAVAACYHSLWSASKTWIFIVHVWLTSKWFIINRLGGKVCWKFIIISSFETCLLFTYWSKHHRNILFSFSSFAPISASPSSPFWICGELMSKRVKR